MPRMSYKKWITNLDLGIRTKAILPAWMPGDQVEIIGTGLQGTVVRCTTLDCSIWEVAIPCACGGGRAAHALGLCKPKFMTSHALNLRKVDGCPLHPNATGKVEGCLGCR